MSLVHCLELSKKKKKTMNICLSSSLEHMNTKKGKWQQVGSSLSSTTKQREEKQHDDEQKLIVIF